MDDEDEIRDMNLSSRPHREDRRKQRERERLAREMERGDEQRARASADSGMSTLEWSSSSSWEKQEKMCAPPHCVLHASMWNCRMYAWLHAFGMCTCRTYIVLSYVLDLASRT